jgi:hypothetical protein
MTLRKTQNPDWSRQKRLATENISSNAKLLAAEQMEM